MTLEEEFFDLLLKYQRKSLSQIEGFYNKAVIDFAAAVDNVKLKPGVFLLSKYPGLSKKLDQILNKLAGKIEVEIRNGINYAFQLSDQKNKIFLDRRVKKYVGPKLNAKYYDPNIVAKERFIERRLKKLNLSNRVWSNSKVARNNLENGMQKLIADGKAAKQNAKQLVKYLKDPVGNTTPGPGVYRDPVKNAFRLTRTETNMAYQEADYQRWSVQPFVVGIEVRLSLAHPKTDICDDLAGKYPKDFKFIGWHPACLCHAVPILITREEMDERRDDIIAGREWSGKSANQVNSPPASFTKYLGDNKDRINGYKNTPYWVKDNPGYTKELK